MSGPVLVTGGAGFLGWHLTRRLEHEGVEVVATVHEKDATFERAATRRADLADAQSVAALFREIQPSYIIHTAGLTATGTCESDPAASRRNNVEATQTLLDATLALAPSRPPQFVYTSTDLVFDGESAPYREDDATSPVMQYGRDKAEAESRVRAWKGPGTVLRVTLMYGPAAPGRPSFIDWIARPIREGKTADLFTDEWRNPVFVNDVCDVIVRLLERPWSGVLHCGGARRMSRLEMGQAVCRRWGLDEGQIRACQRGDVASACPRPRDVTLDTGLLERVLGFRPRAFREGLAAMPD